MKSLFLFTAVGIMLSAGVAFAEEKSNTSNVGVNNGIDCSKLKVGFDKKASKSDAAPEATEEEGNTNTGTAD